MYRSIVWGSEGGGLKRKRKEGRYHFRLAQSDPSEVWKCPERIIITFQGDIHIHLEVLAFGFFYPPFLVLPPFGIMFSLCPSSFSRLLQRRSFRPHWKVPRKGRGAERLSAFRIRGYVRPMYGLEKQHHWQRRVPVLSLADFERFFSSGDDACFHSFCSFGSPADILRLHQGLLRIRGLHQRVAATD